MSKQGRKYYYKAADSYKYVECSELDYNNLNSQNKEVFYSDIFIKDEHYHLEFDINRLSEIGFIFGESMRNGGEFEQLTYCIQVGNLTYLEYDPDDSCFCIVGECYQSPNKIWGFQSFEKIKQLVDLMAF